MEWGETGYRFSCDISELDGKALPKGYTNVEKGKRNMKFSSSDLVRLHLTQRLNDSINSTAACCKLSKKSLP